MRFGDIVPVVCKDGDILIGEDNHSQTKELQDVLEGNFAFFQFSKGVVDVAVGGHD